MSLLPLHFRSRRRLLVAASGLALGGCSATDVLNSLVPGNTYRLESDVAYGPHARQRLDVYLPAQPTTDAPVVVFFYGGSWTRGSRTDYRFVGEALASAGIVAAVADYRLSPQVQWRAILEDCAAATGWTWANAARLGASAERVHLMGHSAGGYNAAMLALDDRWLARVRRRPDELRDRVFRRTLRIQTAAPLREPERVFADLPAVEGWQSGGTGAYTLAVSDPFVAAPAAIRALVAADADVLSITESRHSLEDIYLQLVDSDAQAGNR